MIRGVIDQKNMYRPLYSSNELVTNKKAILLNKIDYRIYNQKCIVKRLPIIRNSFGFSTANAKGVLNYYNNPLHDGTYAKVVIYYKNNFWGETDFCKVTELDYDVGTIFDVNSFNEVKTTLHCVSGNYSCTLSSGFYGTDDDQVSTDIEFDVSSPLYKKGLYDKTNYVYEIYELEN